MISRPYVKCDSSSFLDSMNAIPFKSGLAYVFLVQIYLTGIGPKPPMSELAMRWKWSAVFDDATLMVEQTSRFWALLKRRYVHSAWCQRYLFCEERLQAKQSCHTNSDVYTTKVRHLSQFCIGCDKRPNPTSLLRDIGRWWCPSSYECLKKGNVEYNQIESKLGFRP